MNGVGALAEPLALVRNGAVAEMVLNRPDAANAMDLALSMAMSDAAIALDEDPGVRCVLLRSEGRFFSAGGDIKAFGASGHDLPRLLKQLTLHIHATATRLMRMGKPVIVAVNGPAAGAGMSLALCGDIVLAAQSAHFTTAYTAIGLSPDCGGSWTLPRLIGMRRAQELILTNRRVGAEEAAAMGMITRVVADDALLDEARKLAAELAARPPAGLVTSRRLLVESFEQGFEGQLEREARGIADCARDSESLAAIEAFLNRS
jgi:2-(1,2-epoxy-1,2-dihydrophenyl)acetyl-CoA isomerase